MIRTARISADGLYRYHLGRTWGEGPRITWLLLNPSTADAEVDDPTIRRCIGFSERWGYGGLAIVNMFALRSTDPAAVLPRVGKVSPAAAWDLGGLNRLAVVEACRGSVVVAAWGARVGGLYHAKELASRAQEVCTAMICLGMTSVDGNPRHPLYMRSDTQPVVYPTGAVYGEGPNA